MGDLESRLNVWIWKPGYLRGSGEESPGGQIYRPSEEG
jgi:hypothetical protein